MQKKYSDVLFRYRKELENNKNLFLNGKEKVIVSKNKPPIAGAIAWARAIFNRIKRPIIKFQTKEDTLEPELFQSIKNEYVEVAKMINQYQKDKFAELTRYPR